MTTAYTSLLGLALPVTGELSGVWGDTVNNSITSLLDSAIAGTTTLSTDVDVTLTTTTGAANTSREAILLCTGARTTVKTITAPAQSKIYTIINSTTGGFAVKIVGVGPTTGLTIPNGASAVVAWNGSDFIEIGSSTVGNFTVNGNLVVTGNTTLGDADTDTITQSASYVTGTQLKSAKTATNTLSLAAYDTDGAAYTNLITLTASTTPTLALTSTGVGTINNMSIGATTTSTGAFTTLSASGTLTATGAVTANTTTNNQSYTTTGAGTITISSGTAGTINNMSIGATTAAAGTFTTLSSTGNTTIGDAATDTITVNGQFVTGTILRSAQTATNTLALAAYDTDGAAYTNLITLTASTTPTLALTSTGVGTINNMSIGATTASTGAFTTLSATGAVTANTTTNNQSYTTTGAGTITISSGTAGTINNMSIGATTALAGSFTALAYTTTLTGGTGIIAIGTNQIYKDATGRVGLGTASPAVTLAINATDAILVPSGTTAQQPAGVAGYLRFNSTTTQFEGYNGTAWSSVGGAAISNDTTTATNVYPLFAAATSGSATTVYTGNAKLLYKPSTGEFTSSVLTAGNGIVVNSHSVATSYTIATGYSGTSAGPITIASGQTVTVASGSRWVVL